MDTATRTGIMILASATVIVGLYWFREVLAPFALAVFLWLVIDGFADKIEGWLRIIPRWFALSLALLMVTLAIGVIGYVIIDTANGLVTNSAAYEARLNELTASIFALFSQDTAPTVGQLLTRANPARFLAALAGSLQSLTSDALFVAVYVGFLFGAQANFPAKLAGMFRDPQRLAKASALVGSMRVAIEKYLWVQTVTAAATAIGSWVVMVAVGVDQALFWAFVIFLLNYVPTIGPIIGTIFPVLFALVQFNTYWEPMVILAGVGFFQFSIGTFLQPRMQGDSMNLSTLVVIVTLSIWGVIWGIPGMFLSAPLTVMLMMVLAQMPGTRWIAVILSMDGQPEKGLEPSAKPSE
ncbi:MAG: AI-2E family transporter [Robiginitomaculum sp.]|nr:AI-2E family transporter [Robiginitomaculum sp.]